jgi:excisionase family DNA binding protein
MYSRPPAGIQEIKRETVDLWPDMARVLGVSRNTIYEAARRGDFRTIRVGKRILVPIPEIRRLVDGEPVESIHSEREVNIGTDKVQARDECPSRGR